MRIDLHTHADAEVERRLDRMEDQLNIIYHKLEAIMATQAEIKQKLDQISVDVKEETTVIEGVETLLTNLAAEIQKLKDAATQAQIDPVIINQIDAIGQAVSQNKSRLAADVQANTQPTP